MNGYTVCITEAEYRKGREVFEAAEGLAFVPAAPDEAALAAAVAERGAAAVVVGVQPYTGPLYAALPHGGVIARFGVGCEGLDPRKAAEHGLLIVNTPGALDNSVAELAVGLMSSLARAIPQSHGSLSAGQWVGHTGQELAEKTLLIIGCGRIGCRVGAIASRGFGMRVLGFDIARLDPEPLCRQHCIELVSPLNTAVGRADFISLHVPAVEATRRMVNAAFFCAMKRSAYLINTSRGSVLDEEALFDALAAGRIAGAGLDVFTAEPYQPHNPAKDLRSLSNVVLTPHIGSNTRQANERMAERVVRNLRHAAVGRYEQMDLVGPSLPGLEAGIHTSASEPRPVAAASK